MKLKPWQGPFKAVAEATRLLLADNRHLVLTVLAIQAVMAVLLTTKVVELGYFNITGSNTGTVGGPLGANIVRFTSFVLLPAIAILQLAVVDNQKLSFGEWTMKTIRKFLPFLVFTFFFALLLIVGFLFLIIPMLIVLTWLSFGYFILAESTSNPFKAIKESTRLARGHAVDIWEVFGVTILLVLAAMILFGWVPVIGSIAVNIASMISGTALALLYRDLKLTSTRKSS